MIETESMIVQAVAILLMACLFIGDTVRGERDIRTRRFHVLLLSIVIFLTADAVFRCIQTDDMSDVTLLAISALYLLILAGACISWSVYGRNIICNDTKVTDRKIDTYGACMIAIVAILIVAILVSYLSDESFLTIENDVPTYGRMFSLCLLVASLPMIVTMADALMKCREEIDWNKYDLFAVFVFGIPYVVCLISQFVWADLPLLCAGLPISALMMYLYRQQRLSVLDPLTQVYNNRALKRYVTNKLAKDKKMYVAVIQIGGNNVVNEKYGHIEGDRVLKDSANCLKVAVSGTNIFIGRVKNSKFLLVQITSDPKSLENACFKVLEMIDVINSERPYVLMPMAGMMELTHFDNVIKTADEAEEHILYDRMERSGK